MNKNKKITKKIKYRLLKIYKHISNYDSRHWSIILLCVAFIATGISILPQIVCNSEYTIGTVSGINGSYVEFTRFDGEVSTYIVDSNILLNGKDVDETYNYLIDAFNNERICVIYISGLEIEAMLWYSSIYYVNCVDRIPNLP